MRPDEDSGELRRLNETRSVLFRAGRMTVAQCGRCTRRVWQQRPAAWDASLSGIDGIATRWSRVIYRGTQGLHTCAAAPEHAASTVREKHPRAGHPWLDQPRLNHPRLDGPALTLL